MKIGGFQRTSLIDYPGKICSIIFTIGCNFRCPYCYNHRLVLPERYVEPIPIEEVWSFLKRRKGKIDAVEFTGGEPTIQEDLIEKMSKVKEMGFLVKLDTNGSHPEIIEKCIKKGVVDYVAMDIKAPLERYSFVTGVSIDIERIKESINIIGQLPDYEFRTTLYPALSDKDFLEIFQLIKGAKRYFLQVCKLKDTLKDCTHLKQFPREKIEILKKEALKFVKNCEIRE
ncbi:MAG: anaerobic ribonucleoside-triphosphate reductase activating protein [Deltaproteobacteria bacterium]|nr:anaerobic ribonucleoside-triphosphate reductase activating protein [Deltaproteobacteria bacterium]